MHLLVGLNVPEAIELEAASKEFEVWLHAGKDEHAIARKLPFLMGLEVFDQNLADGTAVVDELPRFMFEDELDRWIGKSLLLGDLVGLELGELCERS